MGGYRNGSASVADRANRGVSGLDKDQEEEGDMERVVSSAYTGPVTTTSTGLVVCREKLLSLVLEFVLDRRRGGFPFSV